MGDQNSGPEEAVKGTVEGVKGKAKEVGGAILGRDDLSEEGQAASRTRRTPNAMRARRKPKPSRRGPARTLPKSARRRTSRPPRKGPGPKVGPGPLRAPRLCRRSPFDWFQAVPPGYSPA